MEVKSNKPEEIQGGEIEYILWENKTAITRQKFGFRVRLGYKIMDIIHPLFVDCNSFL